MILSLLTYQTRYGVYKSRMEFEPGQYQYFSGYDSLGLHLSKLSEFIGTCIEDGKDTKQ